MFLSREVKVLGPLLFVMVWLASVKSGLAQPEPMPSDERGPMPPTLSEEEIPQATAEMEYEADLFEFDYYPPTPTPRPGPTFEEMIEQRHVAYAYVLTVLSGDTYRLANGYKVKLVGVQSPPRPTEEGDTASYGQLAYDFAHQLLRGRLIKLGFDQHRKLEDGTLLAYLFLPDGTLVNEDILLEGLATIDPAQEIYEEMAERFQKAQAQAQRFHRGIWERLETVEPPRDRIPGLPTDATPEEPAPTELPTVQPPLVMPDKIILTTGEEIEGKIIGDPESPFITIETAEGNVIAVLRRRVSEIKRK